MSDFNYTQPFIIASGLVERDGKILLIRENREPDIGKLNFPGGKLDFGENLVDAVKREVHEEAGLNFMPTGLLPIHTVHRPNVIGGASPKIHIVRFVFVGDCNESNVSLEFGDHEGDKDEISGYEWLTPEEITALEKSKLRYWDIKDWIRDYTNKKVYPLKLVSHFVQD